MSQSEDPSMRPADWTEPPRAGDAVHVVTTVRDFSRTTFQLRHHVFDSRRDRILAVGDVVHLVMRLDTRRAMPLADEVKEVLSRRVAAAE